MSPPLSEEQTQRVESHTRMVQRVARSVARNITVLEVEELESVGNEALVRAALRYDPTSPATFATYAYYRVRGAMLDAIRSRTPARRAERRARVRLEATQALLQTAAEDRASAREHGGRETLEQRVAAARELVRRAALAVNLSEAGERGLDRVPDHDPSPEQQTIDADARRRLWALIEQLEPSERQLLRAIYVDGRTMREYGESIGTSTATVSRRHARLLERLGKRARAQEWSG